MKDKSPCLDCTERRPGCHSICIKGIVHNAKNKTRKATEKAEWEKELDFNSFKIGAIQVSKKKSGVN